MHLRRSEGTGLYLKYIPLFKHYLSDFIEVDFFDVQDAENEVVWPFDNMKHRFIDFNEIVF
jgi:hypothetical protein